MSLPAGFAKPTECESRAVGSHLVHYMKEAWVQNEAKQRQEGWRYGETERERKREGKIEVE